MYLGRYYYPQQQGLQATQWTPAQVQQYYAQFASTQHTTQAQSQIQVPQTTQTTVRASTSAGGGGAGKNDDIENMQDVLGAAGVDLRVRVLLSSSSEFELIINCIVSGRRGRSTTTATVSSPFQSYLPSNNHYTRLRQPTKPTHRHRNPRCSSSPRHPQSPRRVHPIPHIRPPNPSRRSDNKRH